jgi:hypothetical protein
VDQNCWLGVLGETQSILWTFKAQTLQVISEHVIGFLVEGFDGGVGLPEVFAHPDGL